MTPLFVAPDVSSNVSPPIESAVFTPGPHFNATQDEVEDETVLDTKVSFLFLFYSFKSRALLVFEKNCVVF